MIAYGCLTLVIIVQGLFFLRFKNNKAIYMFYFLVWMELTLIAGLRSVNVARDTFAYAQAFRAVMAHVDFSYLSAHMELGYLYFNKLIQFFSSSPQSLFFIVGGFYVGMFLRFIHKYSSWPLISVIIFISAVPFGSYVFGISFLRQALAIGFFLLGIEQLLNNKKNYFILLILIGSMFHKSVVICIVLLFLREIPLNNKTLFLTFVATLIFMLIFPHILPHLPWGLSEYAGYLEKESSDMSHFSALLKAVAQLYVTIALVYVYMTRQDSSITTRVFVWISILAFICEFCAIRVLFMNRILYFTVCNCVLIPYSLIHLRQKRDFLLLTFIFCLLFTFNNADFWLRRADREGLAHYEFFWNNPQGIMRLRIND